MPHWLGWVIAAGVLAALELTTLTFILGPLAIAAGIAAIAAAFDVGLTLEIVVFVVAAVIGLIAVRPLARKHDHTPHKIRTGIAALTGEPALVLDEVTAHGGRVKLAGEVWSARAFGENATIPAGAQVTVVEIVGATAIVME